MIRWRLDWTWAGESGSTEDVDPRWVQRSALYSDDAGTRSVTVQFFPGVDVPALVAAGHHPYSGWAALYADDRVIIAGPWRRVSYETADDRIEVQITETEADDRAKIPRQGSVFGFPDEATYQDRLQRFLRPYSSFSTLAKVVLTETFANSSRKAKGAIYPLVFGAPGSATVPGSPALLVDTVTSPRRLMIAGHRVSASTVTMWGPEYGATSTTKQSNGLVAQSARPVLHGVDGAGNEYAYVEFDTVLTIDTGQIAPYPDARFYVSWTGGEALPGGAGDVLLALYAASTLRVDVAAWAGLRSTLNRWTLAGYVSELVTPSQVARRVILPILPVQVIATDGGLAPVLWPWLDPGAAASVRTLVAGPGFERSGRVAYDETPPAAEVVCRYAYDPESSDYTAAAVLPAGLTPYGQVAASILGAAAEGSEIEASWVWSSGTASGLAAARLVSRCIPRRRIRYATDPELYGIGGSMELRPGMVVRLTDPDIDVSAELATVAEVEQTPVEMSVLVELQDDPLHQ